ncbi:TPA: carboxymuconolactone decarboxylase family protein [Pseudomonas aeruginosa]|uniref:carboxymuconolactone decarboxylase family protein n=1 Tax=Pseudomonas TaxID=286 RepID=UPI000CD3E1B9|nr:MULTISPECIES: carboxymuconolactone decarboxylase family protein [Pseudomonas]MBH9518272.1 carboxymuconolactone decarboxylase family protein [Pseudomonas aeruginosa]MBI8577303.1 carboxymuconolactone decarboxylase family protein [Pseudomonas aeruginosa]MBI8804322.1 carboxymuconolactone decarboxylase family protein [Pseudomonas aeruginosa]MCU9210283.1 carboxymuconolactone decarboxylase family protein [Pseudomonas aeruginosa]MDA3374418.1 carboxymuconolactone decarboxylase family protein [Pseudo
MMNWNDYFASLMKRVGEFGKLAPETMRGLNTLGNAPARHLDPKIHELIALSVAITTRCDGCISVHAQAALKHGATQDEIAEALGVAIALNAGAALTYSARVFDAVAAFDKP